MKIAIISDTHDNLINIEKFLLWVQGEDIKKIIHCGDIASPKVVRDMFAKRFKGEIHLVYGNVADRRALKKISEKIDNVFLAGDKGEIKIEGKKIMFCHKPDLAKDLINQYRPAIVFYGHTHRPWIEEYNGSQLINPGTLGGMFQKSTFAVYDTSNGDLELKVLEKL